MDMAYACTITMYALLLTVHVAFVRHIDNAVIAFVADVLHLVLVEVAGATTFTE